MYLIIVGSAAALVVSAWLIALLMRRPSVGITSSRSGDCSVCGREGLTGADWWTLTTVPPAVPGEPTFGGGSAMQTDYCPEHRPDLRNHDG